MAKRVKSNDLIKVDNRFTQMHFKYTQEEMDILFYVMSIIRDETTRYEFAVSDIEDISGKEIQRSRFRDSITRLAKRPYEITHSEDKWKTLFIFKSIEYDCGIIRLSLNEEMIPSFIKKSSQVADSPKFAHLDQSAFFNEITSFAEQIRAIEKQKEM